MEALDAALDEDSVEDDPRWETRDTLAAAIETVRQSARVWDSDLLPIAGVVLSVDHDGEVHVALGVIRQADEKAIRAIRKKKESVSEAGEGATLDNEADPESGLGLQDSCLPKAVIRDLSLARTRAIRLLLARDREAALAVTVAAMIVRSVFRSELPGIGVAAHPAHIDDLDALEETRGALLAHVPEDEAEVLGWCLAQPSGTLLAMLAVVVAGAIDLAHEKGAPSDRRRQALADALAEALDLEMRDFWRADASYWTRLPKAELLAAFAEAPGLADLSQTGRQASLKARAKLKKDDLAVKVGAAFEGTGYLPDLLVTPVSAGGVELTPEGAAAIAAE